MGLKHGIQRTALVLLAYLAVNATVSAVQPTTLKQQEALQQLSERFESHFREGRGVLYTTLRSITDGPQGALNNNPSFQLVGVTSSGRPVVYQLFNLPSAQTIRTDEVWPGGVGEYSLDGSSFVFTQMGMWDGGAVLADHVELMGRTTPGDTSITISSHATHTVGTMIAEGLRASAKGMAPAGRVTVYDWDNDYSEMAQAAADGMLLSNHSYGPAVGWAYDTAELFWYWFGDPTISETEDYLFGYYDDEAKAFDEIAYNAPDYVIVRAAGNDRLEGPPDGSEHYVFEDGDWVLSTTSRNRDGAPSGYDAVSHGAVAKNVIAVGGIENILGGYLYPSDVRIGSFSSYGPTDDGRIKPDLVAVGLFVESTASTATDAYRSASGTSVAAPSVSGSIALLQELYKKTHNDMNPRSATIRSLLAHTCEEAGEELGPDYVFGWGLMNTLRAADLIEQDAFSRDHIFERTLYQGRADTILVQRISGTPIRATIAWTDPPANPITPAMDDPTPALVNDLDLLLDHVSENLVYEPYVLDPNNPDAAAQNGNNSIDNIEQIYVPVPSNGLYYLIVSHKGTLEGGSQDFSLVLSGVEVIEDYRYAAPRYASGTLNDASGQVNLTWAFQDIYPAGLQLLSLDDGEPTQTSPAVGTIMGNYFEIEEPSKILEIQIWTTASRPNQEFDCFIYKTSNGTPRNSHHFAYQEPNADNQRWNILPFGENWLDPFEEDFVVAFRSLDSNVGLGIDNVDSGYGWSKGSGTWERVPVTFFIRVLVREQNGEAVYLTPKGVDFPDQLDEIDEFTQYQIWRNEEMIGVSDTIAYVDQIWQAGSYDYRIVAEYGDGTSIASNSVNFDFAGVGVEETVPAEIPAEFRIPRAYPNPFNAMVTAEIALPTTTRIEVGIFDLLGRKVATLYHGAAARGLHRLSWNAKGHASGIYFIRARTEQGETALRKVSLIR